MSKVDSVRNVNNVRLDLGGRKRTLCFDMNAYAELESRFGSVDKAMEEMQAGRIKAIRTILWAGLIHDEVNLDPVTGEPASYNITPYQVGGWITTAKLPVVIKALMDALEESSPDVDSLPDDVKKQLVLAGVNLAEVAKVVPTEEEKLEEKND